MKTCVGDLEAAVKEGNQEKVEIAKQRLLAEGKLPQRKALPHVLPGAPIFLPSLRQGPGL